MTVHRTAMGRAVDMASLAAKNEKVRAVGNMNVNARGDVLDSHNRVIQDNTQRVKTNYSGTVNSTQADVPAHLVPGTPQVHQVHEVKMSKTLAEDVDTEATQLSQEEKEMFDELDNEEDEK